jgi:hypothetical protein
MRHLILYSSSYRDVVEPANVLGQPKNMLLMGANFVVNLHTGEILKDRYNGEAGKFLPRAKLKALRKEHLHTTDTIKEPNHFEEGLFEL